MFDNTCTQNCAEAIAQNTAKLAKDQAAEDKKRGKEEAREEAQQEKKEAQQDVEDVIAGIVWEGLDCLEDWIGYIKQGLEDLKQGKDSNGEVKTAWPGWVRSKIREQVKK